MGGMAVGTPTKRVRPFLFFPRSVRHPINERILALQEGVTTFEGGEGRYAFLRGGEVK